VERLIPSFQGVSLSPSERAVLIGIVVGLAYKEIAASLDISERTIKFHASNLSRSTRIRSRKEIVNATAAPLGLAPHGLSLGPLEETRAAAQLGRREREVLLRLVEGALNKEIASELNLTERTVKFHVSTLLDAFGVDGRLELIRLAARAEAAGQASESPRFTRRQRQVLRGVAAGRANKAIGRRLEITERTVKHHVSNLLQASKVPDRKALMLRALASGWV
jgi:DNA-binding NarL/FixJ family response regulator